VALPEIFQGPIASEFGEDLSLLAAAGKEGTTHETCGQDCTDPKQSPDSCPAPEKKKHGQRFQPLVPGWSDPPVVRI
jgi:hypothetical protein